MTELNTIIDYSTDDEKYHVYDADNGELLSSEKSLQRAWEEVKDECERRGVEMGDIDYRTRGPDGWDDVAR